jgi:hypothetical protein
MSGVVDSLFLANLKQPTAVGLVLEKSPHQKLKRKQSLELLSNH